MADCTQKPKRISWEDAFGLLEQFVAEHGHLPKRNEVYRDFQLGEWCSNQKRRAMQSGMQERIDKLTAIGLFADTGYQDVKWEQHYQLLKAFMQEAGRVPKVTEVYRGCNIGAWYSVQKGLLQSDAYDLERRDKIEALGISKAVAKENWEQHYREVCDFVAEYHRFPKQKEEYRGFKLGLWCTRQVQRAKKDSYSAERRKKLEAIGLLECKE